jgi:tRNA pseudouridine32 synthase / 23S rRNA pseudouridine746 synthase
MTPATPNPEKFSFTGIVQDSSSPQTSDFLALHTGLSKVRVKDAMNKGAVWLKRMGHGRIRLRKATYTLKNGDVLELHYDPRILSAEPPSASCLMDLTHYSIWFKPANLLTQGTDFGDHGSLLRQVELFFKPRRDIYPVHRLDREAQGLIMVAHSPAAAGKLSKLFQEQKIIKRYRAEVLHIPEQSDGIIDQPLDGKRALTKYHVVSHHTDTNTANLIAEIETGRLHQIRRHLAAIGHPVMGDPRYGTGNKDGKPMRLTACELEWICPFTGKPNRCLLPEQ